MGPEPQAGQLVCALPYEEPQEGRAHQEVHMDYKEAFEVHSKEGVGPYNYQEVEVGPLEMAEFVLVTAEGSP
ncbi:hypothetical protein GOP47_0029854 [Adiantum capillus-veneris]|nr:hypothetical protein GOP47_0029854 [Adiantum capillus-veneris]